MFQTLITSPEFYLAILALFQTILLNYLGVPADIWQGVNAILLVIIGALTADRVTTKFARMVGQSLRDTLVELRKMDKK